MRPAKVLTLQLSAALQLNTSPLSSPWTSEGCRWKSKVLANKTWSFQSVLCCCCCIYFQPNPSYLFVVSRLIFGLAFKWRRIPILLSPSLSFSLSLWLSYVILLPWCQDIAWHFQPLNFNWNCHKITEKDTWMFSSSSLKAWLLIFDNEIKWIKLLFLFFFLLLSVILLLILNPETKQFVNGLQRFSWKWDSKDFEYLSTKVMPKKGLFSVFFSSYI